MPSGDERLRGHIAAPAIIGNVCGCQNFEFMYLNFVFMSGNYFKMRETLLGDRASLVVLNTNGDPEPRVQK